MGSRALALSLLGLALLATSACRTTRLDSTSSFQETVAIYRETDDPKALALAADEYGKKTWGVAYGGFSEERSAEEAMALCERNAANSGVRAPCYLFAVGNRPAADTVRACAEGRIGPRRCAAQGQYGQ